MEKGDLPLYAHQNVREFPDWYKPYGFNYDGNGWLVFLFGSFVVLGWSYMNDIKEVKGRVSRKIYLLNNKNVKDHSELRSKFYYKDRIESGDPNFTKFLVLKPRAAAHH